MRLGFTDDSFVVHGQSHRCIPFLVDRNGIAVTPVNDWLFHQAVIRKGRVQSPKTWESYGRSLYDYFAFLEVNDLVWNSEASAVSPLALWRNWSLALKDAATQRPLLEHSTIALRLRTICRFYEWAQRDGYLEKLPFGEEMVTLPPRRDGGGVLAHLSPAAARKVTVNELSLRVFKKLPKILSLADAKRFLAALATGRERLMARLMLQTGIRRSEATTFPAKYVFDPGNADPRRGVKVRLSPRDMTIKNSRERDIFVTPSLMHLLWRYLVLTRTPLARLHQRRAGRDSPRLFLNKDGEELSERSLNESFALASKRTGIYCHPHMLRHTFASYELRARRQLGDQNALLWIKERLGHRLLSSVTIYLHLVDTMEDDVLDEFQQHVDELMEGQA